MRAGFLLAPLGLDLVIGGIFLIYGEEFTCMLCTVLSSMKTVTIYGFDIGDNNPYQSIKHPKLI